MSVNSYKIGDIIIESKPFVHSLIDNKKKILCDNCFELIDKCFSCEKCDQMFYCSIECKQLDQNIHFDNECKIYHKWYKQYLECHFHRLILRSYLIITTNDSIQTITHQLYNGHQRSFDQLKTHSIEIKRSDHRINYFKSTLNDFEYYSKEFNFELNGEQLFELFCRLAINRFNIYHFNEEKGEQIGSALYIKASILEYFLNSYQFLSLNKLLI